MVPFGEIGARRAGRGGKCTKNPQKEGLTPLFLGGFGGNSPILGFVGGGGEGGRGFCGLVSEIANL